MPDNFMWHLWLWVKKVAVMVCTIQPPLETTVVSDCRIPLPTMWCTNKKPQASRSWWSSNTWDYTILIILIWVVKECRTEYGFASILTVFPHICLGCILPSFSRRTKKQLITIKIQADPRQKKIKLDYVRLWIGCFQKFGYPKLDGL